jgi:hypothetical protein
MLGLTILALGVLAYQGLAAYRSKREPPATTAKAVEVRTYTVKSGLLRLHYPDDFVANPSDNEAVTFLEPGPFALAVKGTLVSLRAEKDPMSRDVNEYARVLQQSRERGNAALHYQLVSQSPANCFGGSAGVATAWTIDGYHAQACTFIKGQIGYSFMYQFADDAKNRDEPVLKRIVQETELLSGQSAN